MHYPSVFYISARSEQGKPRNDETSIRGGEAILAMADIKISISCC